MNKITIKKALVDQRNNCIDYKKILQKEKDIILDNSYNKQSLYLKKITFNLITCKTEYLQNIGNFIAYKLLKKKTNRELLYIASDYYKRYNEIENEIKKLSIELEKISMSIDFINDISDTELNKYLSYKIN